MIEIVTSPITGWIGGILVGSFIGAAGKYYADKYTDQRKKQENKSSVKTVFERCKEQMPELIEEMTNDLSSNPLKAEFVLFDIRLCYGGFPDRSLVYYMNDDRATETYRDEKNNVIVHSHLLDKVKVLENAGFVYDISRTGVPYFRMSDELKMIIQKP